MPRTWLLSACALVVAVLAVSVVAGAHQRHEQGFDLLDEGAHYDYVLDLTHGHVPRWGDPLSQPTLRMVSCVGSFSGPARGCGATYRNPKVYPAEGFSYEAQQPPLGYVPYMLTIRGGDPTEGGLVGARWGGVIWSAIAAALLLWVGWLCELSLLELGAVLTICLLSPVQIHAVSTVTNDSSAVAAGALVVGTYVVARRRRAAMLVTGLAVGLLVGLLKGFFILAPFVVLVGIVLDDLGARRRSNLSDLWTRYACIVAMVVGSLIAYGGWLVLQDARATISPSVVLHALQGISTTSHPKPSTMFTGVAQQLSDLVNYSGAPLYWIWNLAVYGSLAGLVVLAGPVARRSLRSAAGAVFIGVVAFAVALPLLDFAEGHYDFFTPARYALPLLPIIGLVLVRSMRLRGLVLVGAVLPGAAVIAQLVAGQS